jgi:hypothetical protein
MHFWPRLFFQDIPAGFWKHNAIKFSAAKNGLELTEKSGAKFRRSGAGLPDFSWRNIPKRGEIYQITTTLPNGHRIYQRNVKYSKWPWNIPAFSMLRPSKIYPSWYFWFENKPSGNPGREITLTYQKWVDDNEAIVLVALNVARVFLLCNNLSEISLHYFLLLSRAFIVSLSGLSFLRCLSSLWYTFMLSLLRSQAWTILETVLHPTPSRRMLLYK